MKVFIGMETSGVMRRAFAAASHDVISCDLLPAQDGCKSVKYYGSKIDLHPEYVPLHIVGDVFSVLETLASHGWVPDVGIFHPDCTYFTVSAAWAFKDPDYVKYPDVGYHMKVKSDTLTGKARRDRQASDLQSIKRIQRLKIKKKVVENPIGQLSTLWMKPSDIVQPYEFGDDASKATCLWFINEDGEKLLTKVERNPSLYVSPTLRANGKSYWANQTDTGQNRLGPDDDRWQKRADTYGGIAAALVRKLS